MAIEVSVIIPVFNSEQFIKDCLHSVMNQTFERDKYEIIIVNDGSSDNSLKIIKQYIQREINVKVINQTNQGVTKARKKGVENAQGKYIIFVDSDDELSTDAIKILYDAIELKHADIVTAGYHITNEGKIINQRIYKNFLTNRNEYLNNLIQRKYHWGPFARIYSKKIFKKNTFDIPRSLKTGEDAIMNKNLALNANVFYFINNIVYNYRLHKGSAMANRFVRRNEERLILFSKLMYQDIDVDKYSMALLHYDIYNWLYYSKHGVRIKQHKTWKKNLYQRIKSASPYFLNYKDKFLLKIFSYQLGINVYFYLSVLYRNFRSLIKK